MRNRRKLSTITLPYSEIRNLTSTEEKDNGVQTWFANVRASDIRDIGTDDNLRSYIPEHPRQKRNSVHRAIARTIEETPDRFINRNSGITIACSSVEIDDKRKVAELLGASIINGAQTQGEIDRYFRGFETAKSGSGETDDPTEFHVRVEISADPVHESIVETAIARNTATAVKSISQAGARGYLDDLDKSIKKALPGEQIQLSETDPESLDTQKILQYTRLLMPEEVAGAKTATEKYKAYRFGGKCLAEFCEWAQASDEDEESKLKYDFTVEMAPLAYLEYKYWESHNGWNGHRLHENPKKGGRPVRRDPKTGLVTWVAPGILFPLVGALSAFVERDKKGKWALSKPSIFSEEELVRRTVKQFRALDREVAMMGRNEAAYDALSIYTDTIVSVLKQNR